MTIRRRKVLGAGIGALAGAALPSWGNAPAVLAAESGSADPMTVVLTLNGLTYTYNETAGRDLGDFVSEIGGFTQRCIKVAIADAPLTVFFRPDRASDRTEVVFELGQLFSGTPANLGAYSVTILRGGQILAELDVPEHYWFSRWRWQSAPRPIVGNVANLISQNLLPPYDRSGADASGGAGGSTGGSAPASNYAGVTGNVTSLATLAVGETLSGDLKTLVQRDYLRLTVTAGRTYTVTVGLGFEPLTMIRDAADRYVPLSSSAWPTRKAAPISFIPTVSGTYWLVVTPRTSTGKYTVTLSSSAASATSTANSVADQIVTAPTAAAVAKTPYTIMGLAGVAAYMPSGGEREDIGLVTEQQAQYICLNDATALATLRAQAEASGTIPWHMRDEDTGAPISFETYPNACWYQSQKLGTPFVQVLETPITIDDAHQPALSYVPYLLTGDPYHLEEIQFQATWNYGSFSLGFRPTISQPRQFAWSMRTLAQCARMTPGIVPAWLLGQAYWARLLTTHRLFLETNYVDSLHVEQRVFRTTGRAADSGQETPGIPAGTNVSPWMDEFIANVLGWIVAMGFEDWRKSFTWQIGSTYARTNRTSGWVRAHATPYRAVLRATSTSQFASTWAEAWTLTMTGWPLTYTDPDTWVDSDMTYLTYTHGALVYAKKLDAFDATESLSWAQRQLSQRQWKTPYKWRIGTWS